MATPPPLQRKERPSSWLGRNWKWLVPLLCIIAAAILGGFITLILGFIKSSEAYQGAVTRVVSSPEVIEILGEPVTDGFFFTGNIHMSNSSGNADLAIPFSGPNGKATAYVLAHRSSGIWYYDQLIVEIKSDSLRIDLSEKKALAP